MKLSNKTYVPITKAANSTEIITGMDYADLTLRIKWLIFSYVFISNLLLIIGLLNANHKKKSSVMKKLFVFLSCTDILTISLFVTHTYLGKFKYVRMTVGAISQALYLIGCTIFLLISVLRFISVRYPFKRTSNRTVYLVLFVALILGLANGAINYLDDDCYFGAMRNVYIAWWLSIFSTEMILMSLMSLISWRYLSRCQNRLIKDIKIISVEKILMSLMSLISWRYLSRCQNLSDDHKNTDVQNTASLRKKKYAVKTLSYITISYVTCNLALLGCILFQSRLISSTNEEFQIIIGYIVGILYSIVLSNTGNNAIIYLLRSKDLRAFYRGIIFACFKRKKEQDGTLARKDKKVESGSLKQETEL